MKLGELKTKECHKVITELWINLDYKSQIKFYYPDWLKIHQHFLNGIRLPDEDELNKVIWD